MLQTIMEKRSLPVRMALLFTLHHVYFEVNIDEDDEDVPETLLTGQKSTQLFQYFVHEDRRRVEQENYLESLTGSTKAKTKEIVHAYQEQRKMKENMLPVMLDAEEEIANVKPKARRTSILNRIPRRRVSTTKS